MIFAFVLVVILNVNVEIKLSNKTFNEEIKDESSPALQELREVYIEVVHHNFSNKI